MTPVFAARRRAEEFETLVEGNSTGRSDAPYAQLLSMVDALRDVPPVQPRGAFVSDLRERLMAEAEVALAPGVEDRLVLPPRRPARQRRVAITVGGLAIVGATTSMAMAAQNALPGDTLYPLKRAIENAHTGISVGDSEKGATMLANATGRLDEVSALSQEGSGHDTAIADTLTTFTQQATVASDLLLADYDQSGHQASIARLRDFAGSSMQTLATLDALVPPDARDELRQAAQVLTQIDARAQQACPDCGGAGITEIPPILTRPAGFAAPSSSPGSTTSGGHGGTRQGGAGPALPHVGGTTLPPGSVATPSQQGPTVAAPQSPPESTSDPLKTLTQNLTGLTSPSPSPSLPGTNDVVDGTKNTVNQVTSPLTDPLQP